jgi:hypothetical protein
LRETHAGQRGCETLFVTVCILELLKFLEFVANCAGVKLAKPCGPHSAEQGA